MRKNKKKFKQGPIIVLGPERLPLPKGRYVVETAVGRLEPMTVLIALYKEGQFISVLPVNEIEAPALRALKREGSSAIIRALDEIKKQIRRAINKARPGEEVDLYLLVDKAASEPL